MRILWMRNLCDSHKEPQSYALHMRPAAILNSSRLWPSTTTRAVDKNSSCSFIKLEFILLINFTFRRTVPVQAKAFRRAHRSRPIMTGNCFICSWIKRSLALANCSIHLSVNFIVRVAKFTTQHSRSLFECIKINSFKDSAPWLSLYLGLPML